MKEGGEGGIRVRVVPPRQVSRSDEGDDSGSRRASSPSHSRKTSLTVSGSSKDGSIGSQTQTVLIKKGEEILDRLERADTFGFFLEPVPTHIVTDYLDYIKHPMDFSTVRKKLRQNAYSTLSMFSDDINLIWSNCVAYNAKDTEYYHKAVKLRKLFSQLLDKVQKSFPLREADSVRTPSETATAENKRRDKKSTELTATPRRGRGRPPKSKPSDGSNGKDDVATTAVVGKLHLARAEGGSKRRRSSNSAEMEPKREKLEPEPPREATVTEVEAPQIGRLTGPRRTAAARATVDVLHETRSRRSSANPHWNDLAQGNRGSVTESDLDQRYHELEWPYAKLFDKFVNSSGQEAQRLLLKIMGQKREKPSFVFSKWIKRTLDDNQMRMLNAEEDAKMLARAEMDGLVAALARDGHDVNSLLGLADFLSNAGNGDGAGMKRELVPDVAEVDSLLRENYGNVLHLLRLRAEREGTPVQEVEGDASQEEALLENIIKGTAQLTAKIPPRYLIGPEDAATATDNFVKSKR